MNGYKVLEKIGRGGFSSVFEIEDVEFGKKYAIKIVKRGVGVAEDLLMRELEIFKILKASNPPNIIHYYDDYSDREHFGIIFRLYEGGTLRSLIDAAAQNQSYISETLLVSWLI